MSDLYLFRGAVLRNWVFYMTAGPFVLDEIAKRVFPKARQRLGTILAAKTRRRVEVAIIIVCVFYAGFAAFEEEHTARRTAEEKVSKSTPAPITVDFLDAESRKEIKALQSQLSAANDTIQALKSNSDVFAKPISSAQFTVALKLVDNSEQNGQNLATFAAVALVERRDLH